MCAISRETLRLLYNNSIRTIFKSTDVENDNYQRRSRGKHTAPSTKRYQTHFMKSIENQKATIFIEDFRKMIMSADTDDEINTVVQALIKYNSKQSMPSEKIWGLPVMQLLAIQNKTDYAMQLYMKKNDYTDQKRLIDELELEGIVGEDPDYFRTPNICLFSSSKTQEIRPRFEPIRISDDELMKNVDLPSIFNRESCFLYTNPSDPRNAPYHPLPVILSLVKLSKKVIKMAYYLMTDESTIAVIYNYLKKGSDIELQLVINETVYERKGPVHDLFELPNVRLTVLRGRDEH
ncbi:unnamed protein product, partial [Didymodactylos carnosus]